MQKYLLSILNQISPQYKALQWKCCNYIPEMIPVTTGAQCAVILTL